MSTQRKRVKHIQLRILDGENALAMLAQLTDLVRGHTGPRFKIKVVGESMHVPDHSMDTVLWLTEHEIGINIMGLRTVDGDEWEIKGNLDDDFLMESKHKWLRIILEEGDLLPVFDGVYDPSKRNGYIRFSL